MSAYPATGPVEQPCLHRFGLEAQELAFDARPQPEVWLIVVAGALILPFWAVAVLAPAVQVAGLVARRDGTTGAAGATSSSSPPSVPQPRRRRGTS